mgnify:CR=1 FL=1
MSVSQKDYPQLIKSILAAHSKYWEEAKPSMERYRDVYNIEFYQGKEKLRDDLSIQVPDANSFVEGYIASLFSKAPAVRVGGDVKASEGNEEVAESIINRFLLNQQEVITNTARLALIYPMAFIKIVCSRANDNEVLNKFSLAAIKPWDVMLDMTAPDWDSQRWTGHITSMPVNIANEKYGKKDWKPVPLKDYFTDTKLSSFEITNLPDEFLYVQVIEFYDLINNKLVFWSPNWKGGQAPLEVCDIPVTDHDGSFMTPIIPLYLCTTPDAPLKGFSSLKKIYDQIREKNLLRTHIAKAIRRDTRQIGYKEGAFDEESLAKLEGGADNCFVPFKGDLSPGQAFAVIPNLALSSNYTAHLNLIEQDLARASVLAPFTRGEATKATATEVTALVQYTAAEIGKMARARDGALERVARTYLRMVEAFLDEENEKTVILLDGKVHTVKASELDGKMRIFSLDGGSMPLAKASQKQELMSLIPLLQSSGVSKENILKAVVDLFDLDGNTFKAEPVKPAAPPPTVPGNIPPEGVPPIQGLV